MPQMQTLNPRTPKVVMSTDRVRLPTGATTIVRAPIARGKSSASSSSIWASLPELNSRDQHDGTGYEQQEATLRPAPLSARGLGPIPWRDVAVASSGGGANTLSSDTSTPTRRSIMNAASSSSKALGVGVAGNGGGGNSGTEAGSGAIATVYRRNGIASAPVVGPVAISEVLEAERRHLPAINSISRSAAASASGMTAVTATTPAALKSQAASRRMLTLPSIRGAATDTNGAGAGAATPITAATTAAATTAAPGVGTAGRVSKGIIPAMIEDEPQPVIVSFLPLGPSPVKRSVHLACGRTSIHAAYGGGSGGGNGENDETSTETSSASPSPRGGGQGRGGNLGGGLLRGIRRLFGKESLIDAGAAARATNSSANPSDESEKQDDLARSSAPVQRSNVSVAQLACEHAREQERVNKARSSLFGGEVRAGFRGARPSDDGPRSPISAQPSWKSLEGHDHRTLRKGKSFTQKTLEDPQNPAFKTAKRLAEVQEKLSYMEDPGWREKAAEMVNMERPMLMAEGWKV
ncbi:hypothetical protein Vretimale_12251 [Volvox reticuliferus]|uniref:Uncharacterized protein n=1 Tax=Volvox reticuliferus TaxID=1737510 RepID=A0A8J4GJ74_9CHLO|nr:hypothetical protein Vretimale_12251 [Volvox reticuliferus]